MAGPSLLGSARQPLEHDLDRRAVLSRLRQLAHLADLAREVVQTARRGVQLL
jgi:predicted alpha/beta-hydrolase family hydrolase